MQNKIALITGGGRGLGKSTVLHLAQNSVDSILTYHSKADEARQVVAMIEQAGCTPVALHLWAMEQRGTRLWSTPLHKPNGRKGWFF